jgi:hypothetical protein
LSRVSSNFRKDLRLPKITHRIKKTPEATDVIAIKIPNFRKDLRLPKITHRIKKTPEATDVIAIKNI